MVTLKQTFSDLKADFNRRRLLEGKPRGIYAAFTVLLKRGMVAVILYRISRYCVHHRMAWLHRILTMIEFVYTKNEISPLAQVGPGLVVGDGGGVGITQVTIAGKNCTFLGCNSITLGAMEAFDVNTHRIVIGDNCVIGSGVRIMRPISIADGTQIKPNSVVMLAVEKVGSTISGIPAKRRNIDSYDEIIKWNPLYGGYIAEVA